jgi:iron complex outermembrane receptor protein
MNHRHKNLQRKITPLASALLLALYGTASSAQGLMLEEVIVTAQKRSESLQDVPASINAFSGDTLKDFNALKFGDLESLTAGLQIDSLSARSGQMSLRGITHNPASAADATVNTYWNQAVVDSNAVFQQMFDIERIEVLRGPQGTLAGRTSPAGAINMHTAKPNLAEQEGEIRATVTDNGGLNTQIAASFPLIPGKLAVRVAGVFDESDLDEIKNDLTDEVSNEQTSAGRISISWEPNESFSADLAVQYLEREIDDIQVLAGTPIGSATLDPNGVLGELDTYDRRDVRVGVNGEADNTDADFLNTSLVMNWDLENHTIISVTGYHQTNSTRVYDFSRGNANPDVVQETISIDDRTDWSQELRIASDGNDSWDYMVGAYYENSDIYFGQETIFPVVAPAVGGRDLQFPADVTRLGLFTHNQFFLSEDWTLQVGIRYQEVEVDRELATYAGDSGIVAPSRTLAPGELGTQILSDANESYKEDAVTGQVSLLYSLSNDVNLYGLVATGWRPGGVTITPSVLAEEQLLFDSEDSISYELGFKSTLMDGAMRLNGSIFFQDFDDYISRVNAVSVRDINGRVQTSGLTTNGDAEVWGAELDMNANLSENWFVGGTLSYTNGEFADGTTNPCNDFDSTGGAIIPTGQANATCDVGGDPIGRAADWSASINSEYSIPFDSFEGYGRILYAYTGEQFTPDLGDLDTYSTVDAFIGIRAEQWDVELFARNLFDEEAIITGTANALAVGQPTGYAARFPIPARRVGIAASYRW